MQVTDTPESAYHAARAALYCACAAAFCFPDESTVADLTDPGARDGITTAAETVGFADEVAAFYDALDGTDRESLEAAYNDCFGVPGDEGTYPVVPYEAEYTTRDEVGAEQRRIAQVVGLMDEVGLEPNDDFAERQDHVAAELELCQTLAAQRSVALERDDRVAAERVADAEATTLAEHLVEFVPALAHDVRRTSDHPFYVAAADLTEALVTYDNGRHPDPDVDAPAGGERA